jgi:hypothetical protein
MSYLNTLEFLRRLFIISRCGMAHDYSGGGGYLRLMRGDPVGTSVLGSERDKTFVEIYKSKTYLLVFIKDPHSLLPNPLSQETQISRGPSREILQCGTR